MGPYPGTSSSCISIRPGFLSIEGWPLGRVKDCRLIPHTIRWTTFWGEVQNHAILCDMAVERQVQISGPDAAEFLQMMTLIIVICICNTDSNPTDDLVRYSDIP